MLKITKCDKEEFPKKVIFDFKKKSKYYELKKTFEEMENGECIKIEKKSIEAQNSKSAIYGALSYIYKIEIREDYEFVYVEKIKKL